MADYNPKRKGEVSEAQILALFLKHGMTVLMPFGDSQRYDMVVDEGGVFVRVQCKTGRFSEGKKSLRFPCCSSNWNTGKKTNYKGQADVFAVFSPDTKLYIVNVKNAPNVNCALRLKTAPKNNKARLASDHEFIVGKSLLDYP